MDQATWDLVDQYLADSLFPPDRVLATTLSECELAGLPPYHVSEHLGRMLWLMASVLGARDILEVGTLGGYSTIQLARALPKDGRMISLELDETHARIARENIRQAALDDRVEIRQGPALAALSALHDNEQARFDFVFIDADKENNPHYYDWAVKLTRPGGLIVVDNVVRAGAVVDPESDDPKVIGVRELCARVANDERVDATAIQTVGSKGYDGFMMARVRPI